MRLLLPILAQDEPGAMLDSQAEQTRLILILTYVGLVLLLVVWAMFIRKQKARRRRIYKHEPHTWQRDPAADKERRRRRRHERKRRTAHPDRPLNPTLAQTSGLPERRPDDVPPPGA